MVSCKYHIYDMNIKMALIKKINKLENITTFIIYILDKIKND